MGLAEVALPHAPRESPDFVVDIRGREVGIEITRTLETRAFDHAVAHDGADDLDRRIAVILDRKTPRLREYRHAVAGEVWLLLVSDFRYHHAIRAAEIRGRSIDSDFDAIGIYCAASPERRGWAAWLKAAHDAGPLARTEERFAWIPFREVNVSE